MYVNTKYSNRINIKSYIQVAKLIANIFGLIIMASVLMDKNPTWLLSGVGAFAAVLIITFKDTILSLVASMQISSNDLFKVGDWVEAPKFGADGDVIDIALHTVKIQNWDKTISIIPTHKLIESTFKNWKGMSNSGGRRIKRSIFIDINSIKVCTTETLQKFKNIQLIKEYIDQKISDVNNYIRDKEKKVAQESLVYLQGKISTTNISEIRRALALIIQDQINTVMLAEVSDEYAFKVIEEPVVEENKIAPNRALTCVLISIIGGILSVIFVLIRHFFFSRENAFVEN